MKKHFLTQKQILAIVNFYGGKRKYYQFDKNYVEYTTIYFCEKGNDHKWMVVQHNWRDCAKLEVRFTDPTGVVIKRDQWELEEGIPAYIKSVEA